MKFLADENFPRSLRNFLREGGYYVKDVQEEGLRGVEDQKLVDLACQEELIIISYDKDFLAFKDVENNFSAIVLHFPKIPPLKVIPYLAELLKQISRGKIKPPFIIELSEQILLSSS